MHSDFQIQHEKYHFREHSAVDQGSYDYIRDITRIEDMNPSEGYCVLLTYDSLYWNEGSNNTNYYQFSLHEGKVLHGEMAWQNNPAPGSIRGRESPLTPIDDYTCNWNDYSELSENRSMRYLLARIH